MSLCAQSSLVKQEILISRAIPPAELDTTKLLPFCTTLYNEQGQKLEEVFYSTENKQSGHIYTYNEQGKLAFLSWYDENGQWMLEWQYRYNEAGQLIEESQLVANLSYCTSYTYNEDGTTAAIIYDSDQGFLSSVEYVYGTAEQLLQEISKDEDGIFINEVVHAYDEQQRLLNSTTYAKEKQLRGMLNYTYNSMDSLVNKKRIGSKDNLIQEERFAFNDQGQKTDYWKFIEGSLRQHLTYTYYNNGKLRSISTYGPKERFISYQLYKYTYDSAGE